MTHGCRLKRSAAGRWRSTALAEPNSHLWEKFIKPELHEILGRHGLDQRDVRGIMRRSPLGTVLDFRRRANGKITFKELGRRLDFQESEHLEIRLEAASTGPLLSA